MTSDEERADEIHRLATRANEDRAEAAMFRRLAAVPEPDRPPMPILPADIRLLDPASVWPSLDTPALLLLAALADGSAARCDERIAVLLAIPQTPKEHAR